MQQYSYACTYVQGFGLRISSRTYRSMDSLDHRGGSSHHTLMKKLSQRATVPQWWAPQVTIMNLQYILEMYTNLYPVTHALMNTIYSRKSKLIELSGVHV